MIPLMRAVRGTLMLAVLAGASAAAAKELSPKVQGLIDRFFSDPDFENLQLSPNGAHVLVQTQVKGQVELVTVDLQTGERHFKSLESGLRLSQARWTGNNKVLFEMIEDEKQDTQASYETDATRLTKTVISHVYGGHWMLDAALKKVWEVPTLEHVMEIVDAPPEVPDRVLMVEQWRDKFYSPLYGFDPTTLQTRIVEPNPGNILAWKSDETGHLRLAQAAAPRKTHSWLYRESESSPWRALELPPDSEPVIFDRTGQNLLLSHPDESGRFIVQVFDLAAKQLGAQQWSDPVYDLDPEPVRNPRTGATQALAYNADRRSLVWLDSGLKSLHASLSAAFPGEEVSPIGTTDAGDVLLSTESDVSPIRYFILSRQRGQIGLFLDPWPKLRDLKLAPMQSVTFPASDGATIYAYLTLPPHAGTSHAAPLIAVSHGGPYARDVWGYDAEVQYLAALGYAVLQVNYRGSAGYGRKYSLPSLIDAARQSVDDVADGIRWAVTKGYADPKRVVVMGGSFGGYISVALAARHPELPCCTIAVSGVYDWPYQMKSDSDDYHEIFRLKPDYYPDVQTNGEKYRELSPVYQAASVRGPMMLIHGRDDQRVKVAQSELMARALKKAGKSVDLVRDVEGRHGFFTEKARREFYGHITPFLLKYAPPDTSP